MDHVLRLGTRVLQNVCAWPPQLSPVFFQTLRKALLAADRDNRLEVAVVLDELFKRCSGPSAAIDGALRNAGRYAAVAVLPTALQCAPLMPFVRVVSYVCVRR